MTKSWNNSSFEKPVAAIRKDKKAQVKEVGTVATKVAVKAVPAKKAAASASGTRAPATKSSEIVNPADKKKRGRDENEAETVANNNKVAKLELDIKLMILSVKTRSAALEQAEKAFESATAGA